MNFIPTNIPDVIIIEPKIFEDQRGFFLEIYQRQKYSEAGIQDQFLQDSHAGSQGGVLRGLHYQIHCAQGKLVKAIAGEIFDVAVDIRRSSPTFGEWVGVRLSAENKKQLWVPPGFAHGYYVLSDWAEIVYKNTDLYTPKWERTILWNDPDIGIDWPIKPGTRPLLSEKDLHGNPFREADLFA